MFTTRFAYLGRWREVVVVDAKDVGEAEYTVRGRYRLGPYATIEVMSGRSPTAQEDVRVTRHARRVLTMCAIMVVPLLVLMTVVVVAVR